jgi:GNAT superfamily N-acetyltransferase
VTAPAPPGNPAPEGNPAVILAGPADAGTLADVIAQAFYPLPPSRWLIPDAAARRPIFPRYFRIFVHDALARGLVYTTPGRTAAALWLPVAADPAGPPPAYDVALAAATGAWVARFRAFDTTLDQHHPAGTAHHHLALLAVRPGHQGQGTGSLLLAARHAALDRDRIPAYLEAADQRSRQLYLRHGYQPWPGAPFHLPGGGPPMWPMWRDPHHAGDLASRPPRQST